MLCDSKSSVICPTYSTSLRSLMVKEAILDISPLVTSQKVYWYRSKVCDDAIFGRKLKIVNFV